MKFKNIPRTKIGEIHSKSIIEYYKKNKHEVGKAWENLGYDQKHTLMKRIILKPCLCSCGLRPPVDLHNISGKYSNDITDWKYLCRSCHRKAHSPWANRPVNGLYEL